MDLTRARRLLDAQLTNIGPLSNEMVRVLATLFTAYSTTDNFMDNLVNVTSLKQYMSQNDVTFKPDCTMSTVHKSFMLTK